jgi:hypothetical protein
MVLENLINKGVGYVYVNMGLAVEGEKESSQEKIEIRRRLFGRAQSDKGSSRGGTGKSSNQTGTTNERRERRDMLSQDDKSRRYEEAEGEAALTGVKWVWSRDRSKVRPVDGKKWDHVKDTEYDGLRGWVTELKDLGGFWARGDDGKYRAR